MMVQPGEADVFRGEVPQTLQRGLGREGSGSHIPEQIQQRAAHTAMVDCSR